MSVPPYACARVRARTSGTSVPSVSRVQRRSRPAPSTGPPPRIDQTTAASTAKHQTAVVLHHRQPQSTETIMAVATLTLPDRSASPARAGRAGDDAHHPRARPRHHHRLGAACARRADHQRHGVVPPQPLRRRRHALSALHQLADRARPAERPDRRDLVRGGAPACRHRRGARLRRADGDADRLGRAPRRAVPGCAGRHRSRSHATGKGNAARRR